MSHPSLVYASVSYMSRFLARKNNGPNTGHFAENYSNPPDMTDASQPMLTTPASPPWINGPISDVIDYANSVGIDTKNRAFKEVYHAAAVKWLADCNTNPEPGDIEATGSLKECVLSSLASKKARSLSDQAVVSSIAGALSRG